MGRSFNRLIFLKMPQLIALIDYLAEYFYKESWESITPRLIQISISGLTP